MQRNRVRAHAVDPDAYCFPDHRHCSRVLCQDEPRIYVESEDQPERMLLETRIVKDDGYQKQQGHNEALDVGWLSCSRSCRYAHCLDRDQWHRHGPQLSRGGRVRGYMVVTTRFPFVCMITETFIQGFRQPRPAAPRHIRPRYAPDEPGNSPFPVC